MIENEVVFRQYNERVQAGVDKLQAVAQETGQNTSAPKPEEPFYFYCECSDENCRQRIQLKLAKYNDIHKKRDQFIVINGHQVAHLELVVHRETDFCIVRKLAPVPKAANGLKPTPVDNT